MRVFLDTSVFVAAFWIDHAEHVVSAGLVRLATRESSFCAAHTIAEVYSALTRMPIKPPILPNQAIVFIKQIKERFTVVALTEQEYFVTVERLAAARIAGGQIYDALIITAAIQANVDVVYTWNKAHFFRVAPANFADRIHSPTD